MELLFEILREHKIFRRVCETKLPPPPKNEEEKQCSGLCRKFKSPKEFPMKRGKPESACIACRRQQNIMYSKARKEEPDEYKRGGPKIGRPGAPIVDGRKRCSGRCGQWLPADTEHFHANGVRWLKARCKECTNQSERTTRNIVNGRMRCVGPCGRWLPADKDHFHIHRGDVLKSKCKDCTNESHREAYQTRLSTINSARRAAKEGGTHDAETVHDDMAAHA